MLGRSDPARALWATKSQAGHISTPFGRRDAASGISALGYKTALPGLKALHPDLLHREALEEIVHQVVYLGRFL